MKLSRALGKFANSPITRWNSSTRQWVDTGCLGSLLVFDRFVTERTFGQKKRIMLVPFAHRLDMAAATVVKVGDADEVFLLEKENSDVRFGSTYGFTYLLHEAAYHGTVRKHATAVNAAGVPLKTSVTDVYATWVDIERYASAASKRFEEVELSLVTLTFARGLVITSDQHLELDDGAGRYSIEEVFSSLDLTSAKGKRIGL